MTQKAKKEAPAEEPPKKKKGGMVRLLIILVGGIVLGGGGLGAGLYASGLLSSEQHEVTVERPQLVPREGVGGAALERGLQEAARGRVDPHLFQATYHAMENAFTSNLRGGHAFVQVGLGFSTYYDQRVIEALTKHEMAVRSAVLLTLSEADPLQVATAEGKEALRQSLRNAVNSVLTNKEGFGGIEEVHFTSFVTQ